MKDSEYLFSVIVPLYNKEKCIARTINSVLSQSYTNFEIIIVDDGSTDNSAAIVKSMTDSRIRFFQKKNAGVSSARNYGIEKALGEWLFFLDADDILLPSSLEKLYKVCISSDAKVDIVSGNYVRVSKNKIYPHGNETYSGLVQEKDKYKYFFFNKFAMCPGTTLINKMLLKNIRYDEQFCRYEDLEFMLKLMQNAIIYVIPDVLFEYRLDNSSASRPLLDVKKDFLFSMDFKKRTFWEKCILGEALYFAAFSYPAYQSILRKKYGKYYTFVYIANSLKKIRTLNRKINSFLRIKL